MPNGFKTGAARLEDVELWMSPDVSTGADAVRVEGDVLEIRLEKGPLNQAVLTVKASVASPVATNSHGGSTAAQLRWRDHVFSLYVRGVLVFDGPIEAYQLTWSGSKRPDAEHELPGSTVTLTALNWFTALTRRRVVKTSTNARWTGTDTPNRLFCQLIRESLVAGALVTPTGYQQSSETRDDVGDVSVACSLPTAAGSSITHEFDRDINLLDALLELCNLDSTDTEWLWPTESRSGATVTFGVLRGRSGGSRQIGTDRSSGVGGGPFSAERGNLIGYVLEGDRVNHANHVAVLGRGRGASQRIRYKADSTDITAGGIYEDVALLPGGRTDTECDQEGQRFINDREAAVERGKYVIAEVDGCQWPTDFDLADTVPVYTPLGDSVTEEILGIVWTLTAPGPARLELDLGSWPPVQARDLGRAGGGGRGGRGGGGKARAKSGEPENDPDALLIFERVVAQTGSDAVADTTADSVTLQGYDTSTYVRVYTHAANDPEVIKDEIIADYETGAPEAAGYVIVKDSLGSPIYLLASTTPPTPGP